MKKIIILPIVLGSVLLVAGGVCFGVGLGMQIKQVDKRQIVKTIELEEPFENFYIDFDTSDFELKVSENDEKKVVLEESERITHNVEVKDNVLTITQQDTTRWIDNIFNFRLKNKATVYLPASSLKDFTLKADTGDVALAKGFEFENIDIKTSTGNVAFMANATESVKVETSTGDIASSEIITKEASFTTDTGDLALSSYVVCGKLSTKHSTGNVAITETTVDELESVGSTGKFTTRNTIVNGHLYIQRSTGDVALMDSDADTIDIKTSTGDVTGRLLTGKNFHVSTHTGSIRVPSTSGGDCNITTSTGDIYFTVL